MLWLSVRSRYLMLTIFTVNANFLSNWSGPPYELRPMEVRRNMPRHTHGAKDMGRLDNGSQVRVSQLALTSKPLVYLSRYCHRHLSAP